MNKKLFWLIALLLLATVSEFGYIEGQNIVIEYRDAQGKFDRLPVRPDLVRLPVDVIVVAGGASSIRAAMNATKTIPIVLTGAGSDPVWRQAI